MKGVNSWSYRPYKMPMYDVGEPYVCRIVPSKNSIHFEWLGDKHDYRIFSEKEMTVNLFFADKQRIRFSILKTWKTKPIMSFM